MSKDAKAKPWDVRDTYSVPHNQDYYIKCGFGGILSCGLTHFAVTPLDVTKCNMQVNPVKYSGFFSSMSLIAKEEGMGGLLKGAPPTFIGYSLQGLGKFGLYEVFKDMYSNMAGEDNYIKYRGLIYLAGSASAEFFADIMLCPMEMVKVQIQTSPHGTFPATFMGAMAERHRIRGFPFGSLVPLWSRQIPYTMAKFYFFEKVVEAFYTYVFTDPRETYSKATQLSITFGSGYIAGILCALVSQPADNLVSQMGSEANRGKSFAKMAAEQGMSKLFFNGLGPRVLMIGTLTGLQWWIYDTFKTTVGLGTSGGAPAKKG
mmetsp:Transcript_22250/g.31080  ORF Transcript_22250/g.31080 Transcript_22250/m.31080 type:complete len:317 (-) Transcript_22250:121-1071(-)|eukprot:CAMPEP_0184488650 /NCGR_PEP_ID=MMETSP0113_2-20130426/12928_1 /TAXON_ID=91329 /ORGANISM="Norrisiella sphaerica, Strain BC52" /LENGTH=316 /DNA_ID=CAMNT_0026871579 /DNA_START=82 /DNA_END=1032 /DNA_ORIENTATION=-